MALMRWLHRGGVGTRHGGVGLLLVVVGEGLILSHARPLSDFYFPFVWLGYTLLIDAAVFRQTGRSLFMNARMVWLALFPVSAVFWWFFELLNQFVHNWVYVGGNYSGIGSVVIASVDFSTVLPAVWTTALFMNALLPHSWGNGTPAKPVQRWVLPSLFGAGILCLVLPILAPKYGFGLIWGSTALILDPINHQMGRPSLIGALWRRNWRLPVAFALAGLMCGFCWEAWNYWAMPKWMYQIPYVGFWHIFEMPLPGYLGYLPFGLELFAMTNFVLPYLRIPAMNLDFVGPAGPLPVGASGAASRDSGGSLRLLPGDE